MAEAISLLGEHARALEILAGVASHSSQGMLGWIETDSDLDPVRAGPRFDAMIARARERLDTKTPTPPG
ncbi:MAG: hypothetical protein ABI538_10905 [Pseudoxanthomonas sp.]